MRESSAGVKPGAESSIPRGTLVANRYRFEALIARGGMGAVYEAIDTKLDREVAIKTLRGDLVRDASLVARFEREARLAAQLNHPNIVQVHDFGWASTGLLYIVMERVRGETIASVLSSEKRLEPRRAADIAEQALAALAKAHAAGVLHRDVKPGNIMVAAAGESRELVKVLDFGIAQLMQGEAYTRLTQTGVIVGTPAYMPPEQALGEPLDARADVYAVGVVLWCMLTGRKPFTGESVADIVQAVLRHEPPRADLLASVPHELATVAEIAMRKDPAHRFPDANAMGRALVACRTRLSAPASLHDVALELRDVGTSVDATSMGALAASTLSLPAHDPSPPPHAAPMARLSASMPSTQAHVHVPPATTQQHATPPARHPKLLVAVLIGMGLVALSALALGAAVPLLFAFRTRDGGAPLGAQPTTECAQAFACCEAFYRPRGQLAVCAPLANSTVPGLCAQMVDHYDGLLRSFGPAPGCPLPAVVAAAPLNNPASSNSAPPNVATVCEQTYRCCLDWTAQHGDPSSTCDAYHERWANDVPRCLDDRHTLREFERRYGQLTTACEEK